MAGARDITRLVPPAYQEYAANLLADRGFRSMSAIERGVLHSIRLECWVNECVPSDPAALARVLGLDGAEVAAGLTSRVLRYLARKESPESVLVCPQLDAYRAQLDERRAKLSDGGRRGAEHTNQVRRDRSVYRTSGHPDSQPVAHPGTEGVGHPDGPLSTVQNSSNQNSVYRDEHSKFLDEMNGLAPFEQTGARRGNGSAHA